jgi:hypothetical protein
MQLSCMVNIPGGVQISFVGKGAKKRCQSEFKVLVQHQYPGSSRTEGVAHGSLSSVDSHGA